MVTSPSGLAGVVLRYGYLYGRGTSLGADGDVAKAVKKRTVPLVGNGGAVWSFVHADDAAEATARAIESAPPGIYNIVDDKPASVAEWLPEYAKILGAKRPMSLPIWLARWFIGDSGVFLMTKARGAQNTKAKGFLDEAGFSGLASRVCKYVMEPEPTSLLQQLVRVRSEKIVERITEFVLTSRKTSSIQPVDCGSCRRVRQQSSVPRIRNSLDIKLQLEPAAPIGDKRSLLESNGTVFRRYW